MGAGGQYWGGRPVVGGGRPVVGGGRPVVGGGRPVVGGGRPVVGESSPFRVRLERTFEKSHFSLQENNNTPT